MHAFRAYQSTSNIHKIWVLCHCWVCCCQATCSMSFKLLKLLNGRTNGALAIAILIVVFFGFRQNVFEEYGFISRTRGCGACEWVGVREREERETIHPFPLYTICLGIVRACSQLDAKTTVSFCVLFSSQSLHILCAWVRVFLYDLISLCCQISLSVYIFYIVECFAIQRQTEFNSIEFGLVHQYILYCVRW